MRFSNMRVLRSAWGTLLGLTTIVFFCLHPTSGPASSKAAPQQAPAVERELVTITFNARTAKVEDLRPFSQGEFRLTANGTEQPIEYFAGPETPLHVMLILALTAVEQTRLLEAQKLAVSFLQTLRPQDQALCLVLGDYRVTSANPEKNDPASGVYLLTPEWTADKGRVIESIWSFNPSKLLAKEEALPAGRLPVFFNEAAPGRGIVVMLTDEMLKLPQYLSCVQVVETLTAAKTRAYVLEYEQKDKRALTRSHTSGAVPWWQQVPFEQYLIWEQSHKALKSMTHHTGGSFFNSYQPAKLAKQLAEIGAMLNTQYTVGAQLQVEHRAALLQQVRVTSRLQGVKLTNERPNVYLKATP